MDALPQPIQHNEQLSEAHSCAFVLHGLNTQPERMKALKEVVARHSESTSMGILSGHSAIPQPNEDISARQWQREFLNQWQDAISGCGGAEDERIFVGYSLGALVALSLLDGQPPVTPPTHMVLIAPALKLRKKVAFVKAISWLPFGALPSLNHKDYRARDWTSLAAYDALFKLNNTWQKTPWHLSKSVPTLVFLAERDELVDSQQIANSIAAFPQWKSIWLSNDRATLRPKYHHLMLDEASVGKKSWEVMKEKINELLTMKYGNQNLKIKE